jgi:precorrin-6B methylase 2
VLVDSFCFFGGGGSIVEVFESCIEMLKSVLLLLLLLLLL